MNPKQALPIILISIAFLFPSALFAQTDKQYDSIATAKQKKGDFQGAMQALTKEIEIDTNFASLYQRRGNIKAKLKDYEGSIVDFSKAIKLFPDAGNYYLRGISYYILNDYKNAMVDFDATVHDNPQISYELYFFRGNIKFKQLDYAGSVEEYTKSIAMKPDYAKGYYNRGVSKYYENLKGDACKDVAKAKELGFTDIDPLIRKYCDYYFVH